MVCMRKGNLGRFPSSGANLNDNPHKATFGYVCQKIPLPKVFLSASLEKGTLKNRPPICFKAPCLRLHLHPGPLALLGEALKVRAAEIPEDRLQEAVGEVLVKAEDGPP